MFTLNVQKSGSGYEFMIVRPDMCYVSGYRESLAEVQEELANNIKKLEAEVTTIEFELHASENFIDMIDPRVNP